MQFVHVIFAFTGQWFQYRDAGTDQFANFVRNVLVFVAGD